MPGVSLVNHLVHVLPNFLPDNVAPEVSIGKEPRTPKAHATLREILQEADDGNGELDFYEFVFVMRK